MPLVLNLETCLNFFTFLILCLKCVMQEMHVVQLVLSVETCLNNYLHLFYFWKVCFICKRQCGYWQLTKPRNTSFTINYILKLHFRGKSNWSKIYSKYKYFACSKSWYRWFSNKWKYFACSKSWYRWFSNKWTSKL